MRTLILAVPVWGDAHIDIFSEFLLPSLLAKGNLPALDGRCRTILLIYTSDEDKAKIVESSIFEQVSRQCEIDLQTFGPSSRSSARIFSDGHEAGIRRAFELNGAVIFLAADIVLSSGSLRTLLEKYEAGYKAVLVSATRATRESITQSLRRHIKPGSILEMSGRQLCSAALPHLHHSNSWHELDGPAWSSQPVFIQIPLSESELVWAGFRMHLMLAIPNETSLSITVTFDDQFFLKRVTERFDEVAICPDSDEFLFIELSPDAYLRNAGGPFEKAEPASLNERIDKTAHYLSRIEDPFVRHCAATPVVLHTSNLTASVDGILKSVRIFNELMVELGEFYRLHTSASAPVDYEALRSAAQSLNSFYLYGASTFTKAAIDALGPSARGGIKGIIDTHMSGDWNGFSLISPSDIDQSIPIVLTHPIWWPSMLTRLSELKCEAPILLPGKGEDLLAQCTLMQQRAVQAAAQILSLSQSSAR